MKTLPTHLNRLDAALRKQGVALKRHQLLEAAAAAFGFHNSNECAAAAKAGRLDPPKASVLGAIGRDSGRDLVLIEDPAAKAAYAIERGRLGDAAFGVSPYGNLLDLRGAQAEPRDAEVLRSFGLAPGSGILRKATYEILSGAQGAKVDAETGTLTIGEADHPTYGSADWRRDVDAGDTQLGYPEWVAERLSEDAERSGEGHFRVYVGASWPDEPTESDFASAHQTMAEAEAAVAAAEPRGGFGNFIINRTTGLIWRDGTVLREAHDGESVTYLTNGCCENAHGTPELLARHGLRGQDTPDGFYPLTRREEAFVADEELILPNGRGALLGYSVLHGGRKWACPVVEFHHEATEGDAQAARAEALAYIDHIAPKFGAMGGKVMIGEVQDDRTCVNILVPFDAIARACGNLSEWKALFAKHAMPADGPRVTARFHPQAWVNDYAVSVDPEGATEWDITHLVVAAGRDKAQMMGDDDYASDALREEHEAPRWVREWSGPFRVEVEESVAAYYEALDALP